MATFTGNGLVRTASAQGANNANKKSNANENSDKLVKILAYDLARSIMMVEEESTTVTTETGEKKKYTFQVHIDQEAIDRNNESEKSRTVPENVKFKGHLIDESMAKSLPVGHTVVLEKVKVLKKDVRDGNDVFIASATRVINAPNPEPDKTFVGIFTVQAWKDRVNFVQHWSDKAISVDDTAELDGLRAKMDEILENFGAVLHEKKVFLPSIGVQMRAIVPHKDPQNSKVAYMAIDTSGALDWIPDEKDGSGEVVKKGHPLDSENFTNYMQGYMEHIAANFSEEKDLKIEVCPYFRYSASQMSATLALKDNKWDPITQMATCKTRLSQDPDSIVIGKNWAVKGIVQISADNVVKVGKNYEAIPRYIVNKLHANNIKGHVHSWVSSSDGAKVIPHPLLKRILDDVAPKSAPNGNNGNTANNGLASSSASGMDQQLFGEDDDDPFSSGPAKVKP